MPRGKGKYPVQWLLDYWRLSVSLRGDYRWHFQGIGGLFDPMSCVVLCSLSSEARGTVPDASSQLQPLPFEARELMLILYLEEYAI